MFINITKFALFVSLALGIFVAIHGPTTTTQHHLVEPALLCNHAETFTAAPPPDEFYYRYYFATRLHNGECNALPQGTAVNLVGRRESGAFDDMLCITLPGSVAPCRWTMAWSVK